MNITKGIAGLLMLVAGLFFLFLVLTVNSGHTSSALSLGDDIAYSIGGLALVAGGVYAISTFNKKN